MLLQCLLKRDGPTNIPIGGFEYRFKENEHGDVVCDVQNNGDAERLLASPWFKRYTPPDTTSTSSKSRAGETSTGPSPASLPPTEKPRRGRRRLSHTPNQGVNVAEASNPA